MARRRYKSGIFLQRTEDSGKDLYAYLYLVTMVLLFMFMITIGKSAHTISGQKAPERRDSPSQSTLAAVSMEKIGRLKRKNNRIYLVFENQWYAPQKELDHLKKDGRISMINDSDGRTKKMLYIEEERGSSVLLSEYLSAFQFLSREGIGVAFAEKLK